MKTQIIIDQHIKSFKLDATVHTLGAMLNEILVDYTMERPRYTFVIQQVLKDEAVESGYIALVNQLEIIDDPFIAVNSI